MALLVCEDFGIQHEPRDKLNRYLGDMHPSQSSSGQGDVITRAIMSWGRKQVQQVDKTSCNCPDDPGIPRRLNVARHRLAGDADGCRWGVAACLARKRHLRLGEAQTCLTGPGRASSVPVSRTPTQAMPWGGDVPAP